MDEAIIVKKNYDEFSEKEWNRLEGFHFEFELTKIMLHRHLKPGKILDIGGGPGRYSLYLASLGYDVTLVDLSDGNIEFAKKKASELSLDIKAYQGDARDLSKLLLGEYDTILLMGPLYHLFKVEDREKCVLEVKKHLKSDGVLFVSFISLIGGLNYYLDMCPLEIINETALDLFDCMEQDISWSGTAFTASTFIENDEIEPFFNKLGFEKITIFGQEGITGTRLHTIEESTDEVRDFYLKLSLRLCEKKKYFPHSNHIMYIGKIK
ncbi:MAG: class I SAM-dependent methyltransferase [Candidatus Izemoplasmatales bacterium]|nr:class I SAM-dependent methyltransferase [Candidatus Izemoplasmatales bacterium]